jgi:hypothetical protein
MEISIMHCAHDPLYDVHPVTGMPIEVFWADRTMETFGRDSAGWFWWPGRRGFSPDGPATGPFATSYAAYRHALKRVGFSEPRFVENHGRGINAVSTPENASSCWEHLQEKFLSEIRW